MIMALHHPTVAVCYGIISLTCLTQISYSGFTCRLVAQLEREAQAAGCVWPASGEATAGGPGALPSGLSLSDLLLDRLLRLCQKMVWGRLRAQHWEKVDDLLLLCSSDAAAATAPLGATAGNAAVAATANLTSQMPAGSGNGGAAAATGAGATALFPTGVAEALGRLQQAMLRSYYDVMVKRKTAYKAFAAIPEGQKILAGIQKCLRKESAAFLFAGGSNSAVAEANDAASAWMAEAQPRLSEMLLAALRLRAFIGAASPGLVLDISPRFSAFHGSSHEAMREVVVPVPAAAPSATPAQVSSVLLCSQPGVRYAIGAAAARAAGGGVIKKEEVIVLHFQ